MNKKNLIKAGVVCAVLILVLVMLYSGLRILESTVFFGQQSGGQTSSKTIVRDGVKYFPRNDVTVLMILGVDRGGEGVGAGTDNHGGMADLVTLVIFDEKTERVNLLSLNRDMMVDMPVLNEHGRETGTRRGQLAYSHTYGDGMEASCENVRKTVSDLLYGIPVDYYFALDLEAVGLMNDSVGGVTVTVSDDFSAVEPSLPMGQVTLHGDQALTFIRTHWEDDDRLNQTWIRRHQEYMRGFLTALKEKLRQEPTFVVEAFSQVGDYAVTDCSAYVLSRLVSEYGDYPLGEVLSLEGAYVFGEEAWEFHPDETALDQLILRLFYAPKE